MVAVPGEPTCKRSQGDSSEPGRRQFHRIVVLLRHDEEDARKIRRMKIPCRVRVILASVRMRAAVKFTAKVIMENGEHSSSLGAQRFTVRKSVVSVEFLLSTSVQTLYGAYQTCGGVASIVLPSLAPSSRVSGAKPPITFIAYFSEAYLSPRYLRYSLRAIRRPP